LIALHAVRNDQLRAVHADNSRDSCYADLRTKHFCLLCDHHNKTANLVYFYGRKSVYPVRLL